MPIETRTSRTLNTSACPLPMPPTVEPNPQLFGTIICDQNPIRTVTTGKQRKKDVAVGSNTEGQWLLPDLVSYSPVESDGKLFDVDSPGACPRGCYFKIVNNYSPGSPGTEWQSTVTLYYDSSGTMVATATEAIDFNFSGGVLATINPGQTSRTAYNGAGGSFLTFVSVSPSYYTQI